MDPFVGEIRLVGFNFAPVGWALCDGQLLSIFQYAALFSLLGTYYGGNGVSNFALPDLRGRAAIAFGQGLGLSTYVLGETGGEEMVTLTSTQMPNHTHSLIASDKDATALTPASNYFPTSPTRGGANIYANEIGAPQVMNAASIGSAGGSQSHPNMPPFLALNYIIALNGIFPSRG